MEVQPVTHTFSFFSPTGGLLSATSGAHGGGESVELRDGGEELSTPAVKRKCEENSVSLVSGLGSAGDLHSVYSIARGKTAVVKKTPSLSIST